MKKILVVEDDTEMHVIYKKMLGELYSLDFVVDCDNALKKLGKNKYDLMILDIIIPPKGGEQFYIDLKTKSKFKKLKVLVITVLGSQEDFVKKYDESSGSIGKPFEKATLLKVISKMIG